MEVDATTFNDLSVFNSQGEDSVFSKINYTRTTGGRDQLEYLLRNPYHDLEKIRSTQATLIRIREKENQWPAQISNGTLMVIEKYYTYNFDTIPKRPSSFDALTYKLFHGPDYSMLRYSVTHFVDFLQGLEKIIRVFLSDDTPEVLKDLLLEAKDRMRDEITLRVIKVENVSRLSRRDILIFGHFFLYRFKRQMEELMWIYHRLDAYYGMSMATHALGLQFPRVTIEDHPVIRVEGLYHLLLHEPVPYSLQLDHENNFLFLTGANMGGKSTFIRAVGISVFLAHIGMGVPAAQMELSLFDGLVSNIQVQDNILKGESYFFNEVQRIRNTVMKVSDGRKWLILIDELFKGTNIEDAMNCSSAVIKGLLKVKGSLFILSTHLYEIGAGLVQYPNIAFRYFETEVRDDQLLFSYQLREGISNDRIGYLILKREKVIDLLDKL